MSAHELGHAMGLPHEDRWMATMNSYYPSSSTLGYYKEVDPLGDDRVGARILYPDGTAEYDVAGSAFKRTGAGSAGLVYSPTWAYRGSTVTLEFTFSNRGTDFRGFDIGFYLSTNDYISTFDRWLGTNYGASVAPATWVPSPETLTIRSDIAPGTYYLGFPMDPTNVFGENDESNNGQPMPTTITIC